MPICLGEQRSWGMKEEKKYWFTQICDARIIRYAGILRERERETVGKKSVGMI
jgi:hypothetical protein